MTTDNRTSEPTEAQVEAALAAHAAHKGAWVDEFKEMVCPECGWCYMTADERRRDSEVSNEVVYARVDVHRMRAALVAAQGAAPQAESEHFHIWSECPCKPGRCRMEPATVLPSSTVDEGKLSEVIEDAIIDNLKPENTITEFYVPFGRVSDIASVAARAVVEAIGGESRG